MNITVCSFENRTDRELYRLVHDNHESYCLKHGYRYYEVTDFTKWPKREHPVWHKFNLIEEAMTDSDFVFYIDFDAVFTNTEIKLESFLDPEKILASKDCRGGRDVFDYGWNIGAMLIPVNEMTNKLVSLMNSSFIYDVFVRLQLCRQITFREQSAFEAVFENMPEFNGLVREVPGRLYNA